MEQGGRIGKTKTQAGKKPERTKRLDWSTRHAGIDRQDKETDKHMRQARLKDKRAQGDRQAGSRGKWVGKPKDEETGKQDKRVRERYFKYSNKYANNV